VILIARGFRSAGDLHWRRVGAIARKEAREYRRNRSVLSAMAIYPIVFLVQPLIALFNAPPEAAGAIRHTHELLYMLGVPILMPATLSAYAITGERQQGSLEPVLTTPIRREEFILGKGLAVWLPAVVAAFIVYAIFLGVVALSGKPDILSAILGGPDLIVQLVYTPLLAALSTWIGLAISTRAGDVRVAQQLSILGSLPLLAGAIVLAFGIVEVTTGLPVVVGVVLLVADLQAWRFVAPLFDRERLITGSR
jgi:ABC-2 type transport system permease protein